jgi:integrase
VSRRTRGEGGVYQRPDGLWIGTVDLGMGGDGKRRRRTVSSTSKPMAIRRMRALLLKIEAGALPGPAVSVQAWLAHWLDEIAAPRLSPRSTDDYRSVARNHLVPNLGAYKMADLKPQHIRELHKSMAKSGLSPGTIYKAHRYLAASLQDAVREGVIPTSPTRLVPAPRKSRSEREALSMDQASRLLRVADEAGDPLASRWAAALLTGARQGELLGLTWDRVDLEAGTVDLAWQLQSLGQVHGCGDTCGRRAGSCPQRTFVVPLGFELVPVVGSLVLTRPKTARSQRVIPLPPAMLAVLVRHRHLSDSKRFVWSTDGVQPWYPRRDHAAWKAALKRAGLPEVPLHAARNTAVTMLMEQGVDAHVIQQIMGHSNVITTRGYVTVNQTMARAAMAGLDGMLALP